MKPPNNETELANILSLLTLDRLLVWYDLLLAFEERQRRIAEGSAVAAA